MKAMEVKKIAKSVSVLREQARDSMLREIQREEDEIEKRRANIAGLRTKIVATMRGDFDEELIKQKDYVVKLTIEF
jgi:hypothetical protein